MGREREEGSGPWDSAEEGPTGVRLLLVDNYDSFTYNLFQLLAELAGCEPTVVLNDAPLPKRLEDYDGLVLSPGPGHPARAEDVGICPELLRRFRGPVLGVCLGHQLMGHLAGATVARAAEPMHGRESMVRHEGDELFAHIPSPAAAIRYHSLLLEEPLPTSLRPIAWSDDGLLMALRVVGQRRWGVQFHPESFASPYGRQLLANFLRSCERRPCDLVSETEQGPRYKEPRRLFLQSRRIEVEADGEGIFRALFAGAEKAFWLDGSQANRERRYSYLGCGAPDSIGLQHRVGDEESIWQRLREGLAASVEGWSPVPFVGGFVGYLGYELERVWGRAARHRSPVPDAQGLWCERFVAIDHERDEVWALALEEQPTRAAAWFDEVDAALAQRAPSPGQHNGADAGGDWKGDARFGWRMPMPAYRKAIDSCLEAIAAGESYELCLTNQLVVGGRVPGLELFCALRESNPAPHAAFLRFGDMELVSSSPEQFLIADRAGTIRCRPIKGTARRSREPALDGRLASTLAKSTKNRAENLMIVDLLRNDLGRHCRVGSVEVESFAAVESYATVHQLVSTIRGELRPGHHLVDALEAAFPGGSMTGAPKRRSVEILEELEGEARGPYAGSIGFVGYDGAADLNIVIRSVVMYDEASHIGAGGAIVALSDPEEELEEMLLKVDAPARALKALLDRGKAP